MATKRKTQSKQKKKKKFLINQMKLRKKKKGDPTIQKFGDMAEDAK